MIKVLVTLLFLTGCTAIKVPADFVYKEAETRDFILASWQKITEPSGVYKISRHARPDTPRNPGSGTGFWRQQHECDLSCQTMPIYQESDLFQTSLDNCPFCPGNYQCRI